MDHDNKDIIVYTAISGNYDLLNEPLYVSDRCQYVCFTDNDRIKPSFWNIRKFPESDLDNTRKNRQVKILPHLFFPEFKYSVYIDGSAQIIGNLEELVDKYLAKDILAFFKHPEKRNCIYEEGEECIRQKKDNSHDIIKQLKKYKNDGYPGNNGLIAGGIILRQHNEPELIKLMEEWWKEIINHSKRDQISFNYVAWKNNIKYRLIEGELYNNNYLKFKKHDTSFMRKIIHFFINRKYEVI